MKNDDGNVDNVFEKIKKERQERVNKLMKPMSKRNLDEQRLKKVKTIRNEIREDAKNFQRERINATQFKSDYNNSYEKIYDEKFKDIDFDQLIEEQEMEYESNENNDEILKRYEEEAELRDFEEDEELLDMIQGLELQENDKKCD
ncbi:unnamed protein product [Candida verbasci]|uniref:Uncharacterized protein n=1 Tax=Candida verbasci TaxID=1227364 RepID=A0A9W4TXF6_9ASCO|nr:unnamed protein product [Candida verbasci]